MSSFPFRTTLSGLLFALLGACPLSEASPFMDIDLGCVSSNRYRRDLSPKNDARSKLQFQVPASSTGTGPCSLMNLIDEPVDPGRYTALILECRFNPKTKEGAFHQSIPLNVLRIRPGTRPSEAERSSIQVRGFVKKTCETKKDSPLQTQPESAESCPNFRIDEGDHPFSRVSIRNQDQIGACYAANAASMFDYLRLSEKDGSANDATSMLASAMDYKNYSRRPLPSEREKSTVLDGGSDTALLKLLLEDGACTESALNKRLRTESLSESEVNSLYASLTLAIERLQANALSSPIDNVEEQMEQCLSQFSSDLSLLSKMNRTSPQCEKESFLSLSDSLLRKNPVLACTDVFKLLKEEFRIGCDERERIHLRKKWRLETKSFEKDDLKQSLDRLFFKAQGERHPVMLIVPSCILRKDSFRKKSETEGCTSLHGMMLVGQEWNSKTRQCEAIIRNSWGNAPCSIYKGWRCSKEKGTVSIPKNELLPMLIDATFVSPAR